MNDEILVTMIIAIYNGERFLEECIESVLRQSHRNLEIILVDDGATDGSGAICDKYAEKDKRIKVVHQKNGGVSIARNNALSIMNGKYVCFMDQDDTIAEDYVEYLLDLILKNNAEISVVPNVVYRTKKQQIYSERNNPEKNEVWSGEKAACEMLYSKMEIGPWSKMISKKLIDETGISFYEGIFGGEGYAFSVETFASAKKVAVGYKGIYYYRVDNFESEMSKYRPRTLRSSLKAVDFMNKKLNKSKRIKRACAYANWRVYISFLNSLVASGMKKDYMDDYRLLVSNSRKFAYRSFVADVPFKRKIKDLLYFISPVLVTRLNLVTNKKRQFNGTFEK